MNSNEKQKDLSIIGQVKSALIFKIWLQGKIIQSSIICNAVHDCLLVIVPKEAA